MQPYLRIAGKKFPVTKKLIHKTILHLSLLILLVGCQKDIKDPVTDKITSVTNATNAVAAVTLREYYISPAATDAAINTSLANHFASVQEGAVLKNVLYVFLPGTYRDPTVCRATTRKAASMGFHSIGLMYPNGTAGNPLCSGTGDITCHSRLRREIVDGIDRHPSVAVNPANSIINRLYKLLVYLKNKYPTQNWSQYILNGQPNWSKIIIAGHSQGGAIAGVIGKYYPVKKVIMFSMIDYLNNGKIPDWETLPANKEKFFALTNMYDELVPYGKVTSTWTAMGMSAYGPRVNVDWNLTPTTQTHTLITGKDPMVTMVDKYHNGTGVDSYIPKTAAGVYFYDKAWEYLLLK
jgi:hypothetical protein